jgi:ABC-2 type transport system ATP-binding protein
MQETNLNSKIENTSKLLTINKLYVYYGKKHAVEDLTIEVQSGISLGLLGPNGAGKTSTLSVIEGLLIPQSDSILVGEVDI